MKRRNLRGTPNGWALAADELRHPDHRDHQRGGTPRYCSPTLEPERNAEDLSGLRSHATRRHTRRSPDLIDSVRAMPTALPAFMLNDPMGWIFGSLASLFPAYQLALIDDDGSVIRHAHSAPIPRDRTPAGLPDQGWDDALGRALQAHFAHCKNRRRHLPGRDLPEWQGEGLSTVLVSAMRANAPARQHTDLVAPVRPNAKDREPFDSTGGKHPACPRRRPLRGSAAARACSA